MKDEAPAATLRERKKKRPPKKETARAAAAKLGRKDRVPPAGLEEALRKWRLEEARRRGVPAFRIFGDQTLLAIAEQRPLSTAELLAIPGIGIKIVEQYGAQIYRILQSG